MPFVLKLKKCELGSEKKKLSPEKKTSQVLWKEILAKMGTRWKLDGPTKNVERVALKVGKVRKKDVEELLRKNSYWHTVFFCLGRVLSHDSDQWCVHVHTHVRTMSVCLSVPFLV